MTSITQSQKDRDERTAYVALDAIQSLCDRGHGCLETERAFEHIRALINKIDRLPVRTRIAKAEGTH